VQDAEKRAEATSEALSSVGTIMTLYQDIEGSLHVKAVFPQPLNARGGSAGKRSRHPVSIQKPWFG